MMEWILSVFYCSMMCDQLRAIWESESRQARWERGAETDTRDGYQEEIRAGATFQIANFTSQHNNTKQKQMVRQERFCTSRKSEIGFKTETFIEFALHD